MSVAQMMRTSATGGKSCSQTWMSMFKNKEMTQQLSLLLMKKLFAVAVSNITFIRAMFPECAYGDRSMEGVQLKLLRTNSKCPNANNVVDWMHGCFDAMDKKYLKQVTMFVYTDMKNEDTVIESYSFHFSYNDNTAMEIYRNKEQIMTAQATSQTYKATVSLLRTLVILLQNLNPLPDEVALSVKLLYYDEVTPEDYEPKGFKAGKPDPLKFIIEPANIKVGHIDTPFHSLNLRVKTDASQFNGTSPEKSAVKEERLPSPKKKNASIGKKATENQILDIKAANKYTTEVSEESVKAVDADAIAIMDVKEEDTKMNVPYEEGMIVDLTESPEQSPKVPEICVSRGDIDGVRDITNKTKKLAFSNRRIVKSPRNDKENGSTSARVKESTKRVRHMRNEAIEFEIDSSDQLSQEDVMNSLGCSSVKRRKTSVPKKPFVF